MKYVSKEQDEEITDFYQGIKIGDKIQILYTEDEDLADWLDEQNTNIFEVDWIESDSGSFGLKGCDYGISINTFTNFKKLDNL